MEKLNKLLLMLLLPLTVMLMVSCGDDDDDDDADDEDLIGTWNSTGATFEFTVDGQDIVDWYIEEFELSESDAEQLADLFEESFAIEFEGTITFNSDGTYTADFEDDPESGTWTLNGNTLTLTDEDGDSQQLTIETLSSTTLVIQLSDSEDIDLDDDGTDNEIGFVTEITLRKQ